jgi:hypothetical protein
MDYGIEFMADVDCGGKNGVEVRFRKIEREEPKEKLKKRFTSSDLLPDHCRNEARLCHRAASISCGSYCGRRKK